MKEEIIKKINKEKNKQRRNKGKNIFSRKIKNKKKIMLFSISVFAKRVKVSETCEENNRVEKKKKKKQE